MKERKTWINNVIAFWKKKHLTQWLLLVGLVCLLGILSFFYYFSKTVDTTSLQEGFAQATIIYDQYEEVASKISGNITEGVPIEEFPNHLIDAVVAVEDHRFFEHNGIDLKGIGRAFFRNFSAGEVVEGGSTITQQLTKNALLSPEKTYKRKIEELFLAVELEKEYSKNEILQLYMNKIYFGKGAWGIKQASLKYFGKEVRDLTLSESALIAGIIKAPSALNPIDHVEKAMNRRNVALTRMHDLGLITSEVLKEAQAEKIQITDKGVDPLRGKYPYYVDHVLDEAIREYGFTQDELLTGGYQIYTELDPNMQRAIETTYTQSELFPKGTNEQIVQSGSILIDPRTGGIRALVGGRGEHVFRGFNRATHLRVQPGSTMKPIASYTPALEAGWNITDSLKDEKLDFGGYQPSNYNHRYLGQVPMYEAVAQSLNVPAVWLLQQIGVEKGIELTKRFGIPLQEGDQNLSLALGGLEKGVSPQMMAEAYGAFANKGVRVDSHAIKRIEDKEGNIVAKWQEKTTEVTTVSVTEKINTMLLHVVESGTGKGAKIAGREIAGKTGSTQVPIEGVNGIKDQWFVGYTPQLVGAVWVGYDRTDRNHYLTTTSSEGAALIFKDILSSSLQGIEPLSFQVPTVAAYIEERKKKEQQEQMQKWQEELKKDAEKWQKKLEKEKKKWEKKWQKKKEKNEDD
ncbi:PBP1A family penicillin-binding protein [Cytobacillus spongiae]|uniref:transglycosylase domain-containing protein n=1 Tax=Cytobacillus spongiae TaxID=2901381 RepID=UPI001F186DAC|nr:PBP1A family penicillin-binding protein [Cytobacillus spongiae]UII56838.1 PBP1A family penicillin-binding protein [Cytobacillus spongiae]